MDEPFTVGEDEEAVEDEPDQAGHEQPWDKRDYSSTSPPESPDYGSFNEERNAWGSNDSPKR